ncbi:MAG: hypothetical protein QOI62_3160 [Solirubrobacteraceae bacterium]|nr:hypothetical protein [Solirubrobacteraceae bacterium]MEA2359900.1 hypothetical protein [Solirubrobacteraceae bacterium]
MRRPPTPHSIRAAALAVALMGAAALPADASAALVEPPPPQYVVTVLPDTDMVTAAGYPRLTELTARLVRDGVTIATARGRTDNTGVFEVNHDATCWRGTTPDIRPQDRLILASPGAAADVGEAMTTADVTAAPPELELDALGNRTGRVIARGTARDADGTAMALDRVEHRILNRGLEAHLGVEVRQVVGAVAPDPAVVGGFVAVYDGYSDQVDDLLVAGQAETESWQVQTVDAERLGITVAEAGQLGGPGAPGCPPRVRSAVTASEPEAVNVATTDAAAPLVVSGTALDASDVVIALSDTDPTTVDIKRAVAPRPATGAQTWTASFAGADVATLTDGPLTATATFTVGATTFVGRTLTILKDTVAPDAPTASPQPGTYAPGLAIALARTDPEAVVRYTANGSAPSASSLLAPARLSIPTSRTIRAIAIDRVGNSSPVASLAYVVEAPARVVAPTPTAAVLAAGLLGPPQQLPAAVLRLRAMSLAAKVRFARVRASGLTVTIDPPPEALYVRLRLHRVNPRFAPTPRQWIASTVRRVRGSGPQRVTWRTRVLKPGRTYRLEVTPGLSPRRLGSPTVARFRVVR